MTDLQKAFPKTKVVTYDNNDTYNAMKSYIINMFGSSQTVEVNFLDMTTWVENKGACKAYRAEACSISFRDGSHLNFKSFGNKVDISRVISNNKGCGKALMLIVLGAYFTALQSLQDKTGDLVLECVGSVGMGANKRDMPVSQQTAFFRGFGFRKYGKYDPSHIHMMLQINDDTYKALQTLKEMSK